MPRFEPNPQRRPTAIAGASAGIGAATAQALAAAGHPVALGARRVDKCEELAEKIRADGGQAVAVPLDVTDEDSVTAFVTRTTEELGDIEVLVYGAGDLDADLVHEMEGSRFQGQLDVHLGGAHRLTSRVVPGMVERQRGDVVFIGSDVVPKPRPRMGAYVPAKAGLEAMARTMRMELEGTGVRASIVRPGPTFTSMGMQWDEKTTEAVLNDWVKWGLARHPYFLRASDIADAVHHVISAPRGVHLSLIEVEPEAPLEER